MKKLVWGLVGVALLAVAAFYIFRTDKIVLSNEAGTSLATIVIDGNRGLPDCVTDEVKRGKSVAVGNLLPSGPCNSETAVYAQDNAMQFVSPVNSWTPAKGDVETVTMTGLLPVTLTVWLLKGLPADPTVNASLASQIYNTMQVGVAFNVALNDVRAGATITESSCENLTPLTTAYPPVAQRLNVYYVMAVLNEDGGMPYEVNGRWCSNNPNIVLIGDFKEETLAHEMGHAFTLLHPDDPPAASLPRLAENLMFSHASYDPTKPRRLLTTGQTFRINVNTGSALNTDHYRSGSTRDCAELRADGLCPSREFDVNPK